MKNFKYIFIQAAIGCMLLSGCDKYLDITPKGKTLLTSASDYDKWLNDYALVLGYGSTESLASYMTDLVDLTSVTVPPTKTGELLYTWAPQFNTDLSAAPLFWGEHYSRINLYNTVILGIDDAISGTNQQKRSLKAEALLGRALEYFYLVNEYAKPYDSSTAKTDLAVPFVTSNDVVQEVPPRATVEDIYNQLIADLNTAIPDLPKDNSSNRYRGSEAAGYSLLARIYFYARNYKDARKYAEMALASTKAVMIDFNGTFPSSNLISIHPDVIYGRMIAGLAYPTLDFMRSFATNDLRMRKLYYSTEGYRFTTRNATVFFPGNVTSVMSNVNTGTSVQEMKLVVAEAAAREGDLTEALKQLDEIRKNRYDKNTYVPFSSNNPGAVLEEVLLERRHEIPFNGLRWLDMRRLDKENRMGIVTRYSAQNTVIATLEPHSDRYTLQIPLQVTMYHPDMPQNL